MWLGPVNTTWPFLIRAPDPATVQASSKPKAANGPSQAPSKKLSSRISTPGPWSTRTAGSSFRKVAAHASLGRLGMGLNSNFTNPLRLLQDRCRFRGRIEAPASEAGDAMRRDLSLIARLRSTILPPRPEFAGAPPRSEAPLV